MGTEVLRPQDCLIERIRVSPAVFPRRRSLNDNPKQTRTRPTVRSEQRKKVNRSELGATKISKRSSADEVKSSKNLVMGQVTILRRGQSLDSKVKSVKSEAVEKKSIGHDLFLSGTERLGPDPEMVPKQIRIMDLNPKSFLSPAAGFSVVYAGSAFAASPSPDSLPVPSFSKKQVSKIVDDSATRDLRRLLRLD
ncbi:hypothetical protein Nepgr_010183 [Nepenthes gracilis]|uniref:Uncharacterized protein n=1 Tax=Nepenthes gracilis TaxID=150966 RepID=A0AAD3SBS3_NEPGR|nr:hypothetical protein Nepgr_010183 [Nepenthes gracilis]